MDEGGGKGRRERGISPPRAHPARPGGARAVYVGPVTVGPARAQARGAAPAATAARKSPYAWQTQRGRERGEWRGGRQIELCVDPWPAGPITRGVYA